MFSIFGNVEFNVDKMLMSIDISRKNYKIQLLQQIYLVVLVVKEK